MAFERTTDLKRIAALLILFKLACWSIIAMYVLSGDRAFNSENYRGSFCHWPFEGEPNSTSRLAAWDGAHYLHLACYGYRRHSSSSAFYPLWPALIRFVSEVTGMGVFVTGLLLSNLISILAVVLFYRFVLDYRGETVAQISTMFLLAFPGALFFNFIYTEPIFLLLLMVFFQRLSRGDFLRAGLVGVLLPLTKAIGIFILAPFLWRLYEAKAPLRKYLLAALPLAGYFLYFFVIYTFTGDPFDGFQAQKYFPNHPSISNMLDLNGFMAAFLDVGSVHEISNAITDRGFFLLFLIFLPAIWRLDKTWFAWALFAGLVPAFASWLVSYSRNLIMCFPLYVVIAESLKQKQRRWPVPYYLGCLACLQILDLYRYLNFEWAG